MANITSTLDDQQERHYIGNLLCEDDVFGQTNGHTTETNGSGNKPSGNVLPGSGPIGPTPNRIFWPEPPPPYSLCSVASPQWTSIARQAPGLMTSPPAAVPYRQTPTATAVTRTDFYRSSFGGHDEWHKVPGATMDAYMSNGMPYSSHRTMSVLKSVMPPSNTLDTMQQHHYQNMYRHHQHHLGSSSVDPRIFAAPPPHIYSNVGGNGLVHIDSYVPQNLPPEKIKKPTINPVQIEDVSSNVFVPEVTTAVTVPLSKSYRDAASKKEHVMSNSSLSSLISNPPSSIPYTSSVFSEKKDGDNPASKSVISAHHISSNCQSIDETLVIPVSCTVSDVYTEQNEGAIHLKSNVVSKKGCGYGKKKTDYEFQKIIHRKNKGIKSNKNDQVITGEDGLGSNQAVDASSRFNVLQSLGTQAPNTVPRRITRRSLSSVVVHHGPSADVATSKPKVRDVSLENIGKAGGNGNTLIEDKAKDFNQNGIKPSNFSSAQRNVFKKTIGARRELSAHAPNDSARCGRKQRNSVKKRQSDVADYISILGIMVTLVFSIIKHALQWIIDLLWDISLQLWAITLYTIVVGYTSILFNCQRCWYSTLDAQRKCWENIRLFNIKRIWTNEKKAIEWGLSENIQLPITGEEAMERILKCRGRDAYIVLGLRADCKDDDIKRYYKKQAVLVHPDKNHLSGADEAFKILSRAFDAIGTPDVRNKYNIANLHKNPLHKEMEELWERLREKMNEARNAMYCDCGSKHTRIPVESIRASEARYCKKCKLRHPAKHNDIWAETRFGFIWIYYACLDGVVYDITQWATCSSNHLKHMKANSHMVQYRLVTTAGPSVNKNPLKQTRTGQDRHEYDDLCCYNRRGLDDDTCTCSVSLGYGAPAATSQQAFYRPPDRNPLNGDRPRRAGRRRKQR
uniref:J domain-containing protein n=1 Tax=Onchocerca volvulus TaxID=6282 RepID=A0A8R1XPE8_ONCVO